MNIVHGIAGISRAHGGTSTFVVELANAQANVPGNRVTLITGPHVQEELVVDPRVALVRVARQAAFGDVAAAIHQRSRIDVIHAHGLWQRSSYALSVAAEALGVSFVLAPHGMLEPNAMRLKRFRKRVALALYQQKALTRADALYATAPMEQDSLRRRGFRQPVIVAPPGVEIPEPAQMRQWGDSEPRTALFLSRIHPKKNILGFLDAWAQAQPAGWRLALSGPDADGHSAAVRTHIHHRGLDDVVRLCDAQYGDAKARLFQEASLFVLPSFSENFGIVVAEALSYGVPVIATTGTPWELLTQNDCGWWVDPDPGSLATALRAATALPGEELRAMGRRGRTVAEQQFRWSNIAVAVQQGYRWLIEGGPVPASVQLAKPASLADIGNTV